MPGYKEFSSGERLFASDVNDYLSKQTVMRFADASARDTALSGALREGMVAYLDDTDALQYYGGTAIGWVPAGVLVQYAHDYYDGQASTNNDTWTDTPLEITVTPKSTANKLVVRAHVHGVSAATSGGTGSGLWRLTDGTGNSPMGSGSDTAAQPTTSAVNRTTATVGMENTTIIWEYTPSSLSAVTFTVQFRMPNTNAGDSVTMNQTRGDLGVGYSSDINIYPISNIEVMEVTA